MTEQTHDNQTTENKKDLARRWGIVGLGVGLATAMVVRGFSDRDPEDEVEADVTPDWDDDVDVEVTVEED